MIVIIRSYQDCDDAERVGRFEIMWKVLEHSRLAVCPFAKIEKAPKGLRLRFRDIASSGDVENSVEFVEHSKLLRHPARMTGRAVRENKLAAWQARDGLSKFWRTGNRR